MKLTITTLQGMENMLAEEVEQLGGKDIKLSKRAVECTGDKTFMYRANYLLRTAIRVLKPIHHFEARNEREFYNKVQEVKWKDIFSVNDNFAIHSVVFSDTFTHSRFMALKAKDAIVDQFRDIFGRRPNVSTDDADMVINIHIYQQSCTISLDSSGIPLHKRGYKVAMHQAPLNEVLAAGILIKSEFQNYPSFHDPMCGSGTFISEALMMHCNIPAGINREEYAFMKWKDYDTLLWRRIKEEEAKKITPPVIRFSGSDIDRRIMFNAKKNLVQIPYGDQVEFYKSDFLTDRSEAKAAFIIMNPPYDVRLETDDIEGFYGDIGTRIKHHYTGSRVCIFSGNIESLKRVGLKPKKKMNILNGAIPSRMHCYDIFEGKLKEKT